MKSHRTLTSFTFLWHILLAHLFVTSFAKREVIGHLQVGMTVQRGPDWQWGEQDGGKGNIGVIIEVTHWRGPSSLEKRNVDVIAQQAQNLNYRSQVDTTTNEFVQEMKSSGSKHFHATMTEGSEVVKEVDEVNAVRVLWKALDTSNVYRYGAGGFYDVKVISSKTEDIDWEAITKQLNARVEPLPQSCHAKDKLALIALRKACHRPSQARLRSGTVSGTGSTATSGT